jgi:hypothetical protein
VAPLFVGLATFDFIGAKPRFFAEKIAIVSVKAQQAKISFFITHTKNPAARDNNSLLFIAIGSCAQRLPRRKKKRLYGRARPLSTRKRLFVLADGGVGAIIMSLIEPSSVSYHRAAISRGERGE